MQVSSNASGRGVLRLIRLHNRLNLLNVLAIIVQGMAHKSHLRMIQKSRGSTNCFELLACTVPG